MKRTYKWILILVIAVISCGAYATALLKPVEVDAETMVLANLENSFMVQGTILPEKSVVLNAPAAGEVTEVAYRAGMSAKAGDTIIQTGSTAQTDLDIKREQFRQQLTVARQEYDRLFGKNGTAKAQVTAAQSEFDLVDRNYGNAKALADQGSVSQTELSTLKTQRDLADQRLSQAKENNSESNRAFYREQITSYEKQLSMLEDSVSPGAVLMPYDGVVWELYADQGQYLAPNQPVAKIYQPGELKIEASLLSEDAFLIKEGQQAQIQFADGSIQVAGVTFVSPVASQEMSTIGLEENRCKVELKAESFPEQAGAGQRTDVIFTLIEAQQVLAVPSSAMVPDKTGSAVYVIENKKASLQRVETGRKSGGRTEVLSGLSEGDVVISDPYEGKIKENSRVQTRQQ